MEHNNSQIKIIPLGGISEVTKNAFVYDNGRDIIIVDFGIGFPDEPEGEEEKLIIPDMSYILANKDRVRGLLVTHAHFDHYGAIPNLLEKINLPVYASRLTQEFIKEKAEEMGMKSKYIDFKNLNNKTSRINIGSFKITPFHINHSIPESMGLFIDNPIGSILHVADYKFDWTPVDEEPFDLKKLINCISYKQPLLLLSDCLGAVRSGHTRSESTIKEELENIIIRAKGLVIITTVTSNISRIKQAIQASLAVGRKVSFLGRSLEKSFKIAKGLGYFSQLKSSIISQNKIKKTPREKLTVIAAGSYGQADSALVRISQQKHRLVNLQKGDSVIFSADPAPPGVLNQVNNTIDNLTRLKVRVYYYEIQDNLHVSGHGTAEDIKMLIALVKPKYLLPIGGDYRHMFAFSLLAQQMGYKEEQVLLLESRQQVSLGHFQLPVISKII